MKPRIGSLCSGYAGLDMAVAEVFGGEVAWFFEYEAAPSKVLAYRFPTVANFGDLTKAAWQVIAPVRVMCGGTPCQDLSAAGKRMGMTEGTRSNLWVQMREGIAIQRPEYVVWENVRGAYSAGADSEVEREEGLLGVTPRGSLRALGRVLGDLSSLGYDAAESYLKRVRKRLAGLDIRPVGMRGSLAPVRNLSARFVEWMMGLPLGWVTDPAIGLTRNEQLKALGNGVVTQQAAAAIRIGLARLDEQRRWELSA